MSLRILRAVPTIRGGVVVSTDILLTDEGVRALDKVLIALDDIRLELHAMNADLADLYTERHRNES